MIYIPTILWFVLTVWFCWFSHRRAERRFRHGWNMGSANTRLVVAKAHPALLDGDEIQRQALEELRHYEKESAQAMIDELAKDQEPDTQ